MVTAETDDHETRYELPEALRPVAQAQLADSGEADAIHDRLVAFYPSWPSRRSQRRLARSAPCGCSGSSASDANFRAALKWLIERGEAERGLRLADLLQELWFEEQHTSEGRAWFATLLAMSQAAARTTQRAQALDLAGAYALIRAITRPLGRSKRRA